MATAGVAAADVEWSGSAGAGIFYDADNTGDTDTDYDGTGVGMYNFVNLQATLSGETENGLTFGGSVGVDVGRDFDTGDFEFDGDEDGTAGFDSLFISGAFGTITFDHNGVDNLYDDDFDAHDIMYAYDVSGFSVALTYDVQADSGAGELWSMMLGYDMDGISASLAIDDSDDVNVELAYDVTSEVTVGLGYDTGAGEAHSGNDYSTDLSVDYDDGTFAVGAMVDSDENYEVSFGYSMDGLDLGVAVFNDESANETDYTLTGSYDLGGGLSVIGGYDNDESAHTNGSVWYLGAAMSF